MTTAATIRLSLFDTFFHSISLSIYIYKSLYIYIYINLSLSFFLPIHLFIFLSYFLFFSLSPCSSFSSLFFSPFLFSYLQHLCCLYLYLTVPHFVSLFLSLFLSSTSSSSSSIFALSLSLPHCPSLYLSLPTSLSLLHFLFLSLILAPLTFWIHGFDVNCYSLSSCIFPHGCFIRSSLSSPAAQHHK